MMLGFRGKGQFFVGRSSDSADEMDSGIRSNSEPATPVVSEEENDHAQIGVSRRFIVRKSFPVLASADANHSEHRYANHLISPFPAYQPIIYSLHAFL